MLLLVCAAPGRAARPANCSKLSPRAELRCAKAQFWQAHREARAPVSSPPHSKAYWLWRVRVAKRWIRQAHYRIKHLPVTHDWQTAVWIVQRVWPGTAAWMLSCSAHEGGHGGFVMNYQGSGAGGWMQYMVGTFDWHYRAAVEAARQRHLAVPPSWAARWTSPLGQAFAAGWGYFHNRSAWMGDPWC